jgi:adenylosuccinate synthase
MTTSTVVIGANFGDEGKGLITDFEARRLKSRLVARFNGGAQAGHTVVTNGGSRFVFGHLSSGTFIGADTYLSSKYIVNPLILEREIGAFGCSPYVFVHQDAPVTTVYDMAINALAEISRGGNRHGSCGMGINETVTRHESYPLDLNDALNSPGGAWEIIKEIQASWVPARLKALGITDIPMQYRQALETNPRQMALQLKEILKRYVKCVEHHTDMAMEIKMPVVFEGAQGLMLDEYLGDFPHVTRSITGLPYAVIAAKELGLKKIKPIYVTRAYCTRHGAGDLLHEGELGFSPVDLTNVENPWQQKIRFAPLSVHVMQAFIKSDLERGIHVGHALGVQIEEPTLAVTCLDQIQDQIPMWFSPYARHRVKKDDVPAMLQSALGIKVSHISRGPTADDVQYIE